MQKIDTLGQALIDYYNNEIKGDVIVNCSVAEPEIFPVEYFFREHKDLTKLEKKAIKLCKGKTLDIGAGTGCHTLILKDLGFDVNALDISQEMIDLMKKRNINAIKSDIFEYNSDKYDTLLMLMNGLGMVKTISGLNKFLKYVKKNLLNKEGQIILNSTDLKYAFLEEDGSFCINLNEKYYGEIVYQIEYNNEKGSKFKWLYIDFDTLSYYANINGFEAKKILEEDEYSYLAVLKAV